jgi:hypothetical protein
LFPRWEFYATIIDVDAPEPVSTDRDGGQTGLTDNTHPTGERRWRAGEKPCSRMGREIMFKIHSTAFAALTVSAAVFVAQSIASAEEHKKSGPAATPAPAARPAPAAKPAAPAVRPAPAARAVAPAARQAPIVRQSPPVVRQAPPVARQAPVIRAPATVATPQAAPRTQGPAAAAPTTKNQGFTTGSAPGMGRTALSLRGAGRATIAGRSFPIYRSGFRVHRDGYWRTLVALSALSAISYGATYYYPYAYIDTSYDFCQGWTDDGCNLRWEPVPTIDGSTEYECVAYCPFR